MAQTLPGSTKAHALRMPDVRAPSYVDHRRMTVIELPLTIRRASAESVRDLAALDSAPVLQGDVLVGAVGSEVVAAVSLDDYRAIADPFRATADVVATLEQRARQLSRAA
jgi:hypothetical protein